MTATLKQLFNWRIHLLALVLACLAELIGIARFDIGIGTVLLLPLLYAFVFSVFFNPNIVSPLGRFIGKEGNKISTQWILIFLMPFIAKFAVGIGPNINEIIAAGPSLILQELGNVGTVVFALPVAVLLFGGGYQDLSPIERHHYIRKIYSGENLTALEQQAHMLAKDSRKLKSKIDFIEASLAKGDFCFQR